MNRRKFLHLTGSSFLLTAAGGTENSPERPNIVFILADDLGYGDLGCYGQQKILTPNLDRMAAQGTRFTGCYAGAPVCAPSRNVLMTGQHSGHATVRGNSPKVGGTIEAFGEGGRRLSLPASDVTLAEVLQAEGYRTGITGKWGLGEPGTDGIPTRQGFDEWLGYLNQNHAPYYYTDYLWRNEEKYLLEGNANGRKEQYTHDLFTQFALDFIDQNRARPFFLYIPYTIPHRRFEVPSVEPYSIQDWPLEAQIYAAMITRMDRDVGRILQRLKDNGLEERTLVFFASDNGAEDKPWKELFHSNYPFRGGKSRLYEGGIRIPMIARWPGQVPAGRINDEPWYFADVLPTAADLAGTHIPPQVDGASVKDLLTGKKDQLPDRFLYWEFLRDDLNQAVRWKNWKGLRLAPNLPLRLFDLKEDPAETRDVASQHPAVIKELTDYLRTARTDSPHWPLRTSP